MALTPSNMMPLGTSAPDFELLDTVSGARLSLNQVKGVNATLVMFICNHCPFVQHIEDALIDLGNDYGGRGVGIVAISSNDVENYPADSPEAMARRAAEKSYPFPYLFDESQAVAKSYAAACTPDFYLFDADLKCVYRGRFDDSRPGNDVPVTGADLRRALDALLTGEPISYEQQASMGCNIKWKVA